MKLEQAHLLPLRDITLSRNRIVRVLSLCCTILIAAGQGCTSYYVLTREEITRGTIPAEASIRVTRNDGSKIESGPFRHLMVGETSDLVTGSGKERRSGKLFTGTLSRSEIDSARQIQVLSPDGVPVSYFVCWLKNKISMSFLEYEYLNVTPGDAPGLWCAGTVADQGSSRPFKGRIDSLDIKMVEAEELSLFHSVSSTQGRHWANIGIGGGKGAAALLVSYSYLAGNTLYGVRMIGTFPVPVPEVRQSSFFEFGGLFGLGMRSRFLTATVSGGVSYVRGSEKGVFSPGEFSTVSFPLDLEVALTPFESFGAGIKVFSTSNSKKSWSGAMLFLQFGM